MRLIRIGTVFYPPTQDAEQDHHRDFVDHGTGDQE